MNCRLEFSTAGPARGEDGKKCTKAQKGAKIKLTAQHLLLVNKCYACLGSKSGGEGNGNGWRIK